MDNVKLHAMEQTQLRRQHRDDGVGRLKFDFHTAAYSAFGGTPSSRKISAPSTTVTAGGGGGGTKMLPMVSLRPICIVALGVGRRGLDASGRGATSAEALARSATAPCLLKVGAIVAVRARLALGTARYWISAKGYSVGAVRLHSDQWHH